MTPKPEPLDLQYHLTAESRRRTIPNLKELYQFMQEPGMVSLAGGTPFAEIFPFDDVRVRSLAPPFANGIAESKLDTDSPLKVQVFEQPAGGDDGDIELSTALQYGSAAGDERLRQFMIGHFGRVHDVGFRDWELILSVGNTFAWDAVLRTFCEPGEVILCEEFTFPSALENARTRGCRVEPTPVDEFGIIPSELERVAALHRPKLLYTIPTGQNPTGSVLPAERRKQIYAVAKKFDFLIVEDEPYYYLQMGQFERGEEHVEPPQSRDSFLASLVPSFLHYDTDGRVIRLDSFSKVMAPGVRMSWIVAQPRFAQALQATAESSSSKPSGFAQALIYGVLRRWGQDGFVDWLMGLRAEYTRRRDRCCNALYKYLGSAPFELITPRAGMFVWLKFDATQFGPERPGAEVERELFYKAAKEHKVLLVPGHWCAVKPDKSSTGVFFRGSFASEPLPNIEEGVKRFAEAMSVSTCKDGLIRGEELVVIHPGTNPLDSPPR